MKLSKSSMGVITTLILVILLTQSRFFDFLTETPLGRMVLLAFIIFISYINKILGLFVVLCIIIAFNQHGNTVQSYNYYEGFDNVPSDEIVNDKVAILKAKEDELNQKLKELNNTNEKTSETITTTSSANTTATEGFCMAERELTILRGKQSNSIPVFDKAREQDDDVSPSDKSIFSNLFTIF